MDIIEVLLEKCRSSMRVNTFEINSVLSNPSEHGSLDRLSNAMYDYTKHQTTFENLLKLKNQIEEANTGKQVQDQEEGDEN